MKFENTSVWGFFNAIKGMRNPKNSWHNMDSFTYDITMNSLNNNDDTQYIPYYYHSTINDLSEHFILGENDKKLAQRLILSGTEHRKFLRQIFISVDITAPIYWWKEFDTYKIGTTANSTSTMHKLIDSDLTLNNFEHDNFAKYSVDELEVLTKYINWLDKLKIEAKENKESWRKMVQWLPCSWLQKRTVTMNYEVVRSMYFHRRNHKLSEWSCDFVQWVQTLPYSQEFLMLEKKENSNNE